MGTSTHTSHPSGSFYAYKSNTSNATQHTHMETGELVGWVILGLVLFALGTFLSFVLVVYFQTILPSGWKGDSIITHSTPYTLICVGAAVSCLECCCAGNKEFIEKLPRENGVSDAGTNAYSIADGTSAGGGSSNYSTVHTVGNTGPVTPIVPVTTRYQYVPYVVHMAPPGCV
jgi:hypothetical protein